MASAAAIYRCKTQKMFRAHEADLQCLMSIDFFCMLRRAVKSQTKLTDHFARGPEH